MSDKVQKSVRVAPDLAEYIEQEAEERGIKEVDVMRQLFRDGVRYRESVDDLHQRVRSVQRRLSSVEENTQELAEESNTGLFG